MRTKLINLIHNVQVNDEKYPDFTKKVEEVDKLLNDITQQNLSNILIESSVLPEEFKGSSTEEKLWAKFTDNLLAKAFKYLGFETEVVKKRANTFDVKAKSNQYSIAGDAKAIRLSRTTLNAKDLKVSALNNWRKAEGLDYALLLAPFRNFLQVESQVYNEAIEFNITFLTYNHLKFLIDNYKNQNLKNIWEVGNEIRNSPHIKKPNWGKAVDYWNKIDEAVCKSVNKTIANLGEYKTQEKETLKKIGSKEIENYQNKLKEQEKRFDPLDKNETIMILSENKTKEEILNLFLDIPKIKAKIKTIEKAINSKVKI